MVAHEIRRAEELDLKTDVARVGISRRLALLKRPAIVRSLTAVLGDWVLILSASAVAVNCPWWMIPISLLVIGNRQQALNNLLHESSHKNLAATAFWNDLIGQWLCALPLFTSLDRYRRDHMAHHRHLGDLTKDPDYLKIAFEPHGWTRLWLGQMFDRRHIVDFLFGSLLKLNGRERAATALWWCCALAAVSLAVAPSQAAAFVILWMTARMTVFYPVATFREMTDHYGLDLTSWLRQSRNVAGSRVLAVLIHPHADGYHLTHHLFPNIPYHSTFRAHRLLMRAPAYAELHHCDGYVRGKHSLLACMSQQCPAENESPSLSALCPEGVTV